MGNVSFLVIQAFRPKLNRTNTKMAFSPLKKLQTDSQLLDMPTAEVVKDTQAFLTRFANLYNSPTFSDLVLKVGDDRFFAHRFILVTASNVFRVMFKEECWKEARQPEVCLTEEEECIPVFPAFLRYLYSAEVSMTTETVLPLLLMADKYEVQPLQDSCLAYMIRHIVESPDTNKALTWFQHSQMTGQETLRDQCLGFILSNFDVVMKAGDWTEMALLELKGFLGCSDMVVCSEAELWANVEKWLMSESNHVEENLKEVLPLIRFSMMLPKTLLQIEHSALCQQYTGLFADKLSFAYRRHSLVLDSGYDQLSIDTPSENPPEPFRNYYSEEYCLSHSFLLINCANISKGDSRITIECKVRQRFLSPARTKSEDFTLFTVYFYPRGYFTTITLYGYLGRQSDNVLLKVIRRQLDLKPMKVEVTLVLFGKKNNVKYAAFTHSCSMVFTKENSTLTSENIFDLEKLMKENSPYLIDGNLEGSVFIKIQDIGDHLVKDMQKK